MTAPELEVVCVTGLPARTENVRAVFFCAERERTKSTPHTYYREFAKVISLACI